MTTYEYVFKPYILMVFGYDGAQTSPRAPSPSSAARAWNNPYTITTDSALSKFDNALCCFIGEQRISSVHWAALYAFVIMTKWIR